MTVMVSIPDLHWQRVKKLHLFFTGNVKIDGDYDYINEGRETSTLHVESEDGIHFGDKEEIISFEKYPEEFTCHIRDPKVWKEKRQVFYGSWRTS